MSRYKFNQIWMSEILAVLHKKNLLINDEIIGGNRMQNLKRKFKKKHKSSRAF